MSPIIGSLILTLAIGPIPATAVPQERPSRIVSWNAYSIQFIDPPVFQLLPFPGTRTYQALVEQGGKTWKVVSVAPRLELAAVWVQIPVKAFRLTLRWLENGIPKGEPCGHNWYNTNAVAAASLYMLDGYRARLNGRNVRD